VRAVGYARLSKPKRNEDGTVNQDPYSIEVQRQAIKRAAEYNGWDLLDVHVDNGKTGAHTRRSGLQDALSVLGGGEADMLVIAKYDRLSRDHLDFGTLLKTAEKQGWYVSVLDQKIDTTTAMGWYMASQMALSAELERRLISERTRDALALRKANGAQLGWPSTISPQLRRRIVRLHRNGHSASAIARRLSADGIPTPTGKATWHHSVIVDLLRRNTKEPA
jgi:DNA invertase Pin-like site-specific DNA recombinase